MKNKFFRISFGLLVVITLLFNIFTTIKDSNLSNSINPDEIVYAGSEANYLTDLSSCGGIDLGTTHSDDGCFYQGYMVFYTSACIAGGNSACLASDCGVYYFETVWTLISCQAR